MKEKAGSSTEKRTSYTVEIRDVEPVRAAVMSYKGPVTNAGKQVPAVFKAIKGRSNGAPFFCFYSVDDNTNIGDMELCVPTPEDVNAEGIFIKEYPGGKAVCVTHIGPYSSLPAAYAYTQKYIKEHKLTVHPPSREVYIKGPGMLLKGDPRKYITEIIFPLREG